MTSLVKAIQERLAKICEEFCRYPEEYAPFVDQSYIYAVDQCAAAIRDADLSDLEPKEGATPLFEFEKFCPDGQKCGATTTGCLVGKCQRKGTITCKHFLNLQAGESHTLTVDCPYCRSEERERERELAALTARLEAAEGELNEWEKQAKKFNLDCQDAQSRAFKAERDLEAMRSAERVAKMQERK